MLSTAKDAPCVREGEDKKQRGGILMYYYKIAVIDKQSLIIMAYMQVVYYCAVDISDYIVVSCCKMCLIVIFSGVKLLA